MSVLVSTQGAFPVGADGGRIDHYVCFLRVEPRLCVLVAVALNAEVGVDDEEFYFYENQGKWMLDGSEGDGRWIW